MKNLRVFILLLSVTLVIIFCSCTSGQQQTETTPESTEPLITITAYIPQSDGSFLPQEMQAQDSYQGVLDAIREAGVFSEPVTIISGHMDDHYVSLNESHTGITLNFKKDLISMLSDYPEEQSQMILDSIAATFLKQYGGLSVSYLVENAQLDWGDQILFYSVVDK